MRPPGSVKRRVILPEHSEVDSESRREPAVSIARPGADAAHPSSLRRRR